MRLTPLTVYTKAYVPFDKPVSQELFHGSSVQQLDGLVDFLMNYDRYAESQTSIKPLIVFPLRW